MARSHKYAVIRLSPADARDERLNVGIAVFSDLGIDVRPAKRLDKVRAISEGIDVSLLRQLLSNLRTLDAQFIAQGYDIAQRIAALARTGILSLSTPGIFEADSASAYDVRIGSILQHLVEPEPAPKKLRMKRSQLLSQMKLMFRNEKVLARRDEKIDSHRIVSGYQVDEGLVADLALKNGAMHIVETVDASDVDGPLRRAVSDIAVSALVLECARIKFGKKGTVTRLVYNASKSIEVLAKPSLEAAAHQGAQLTNWASMEERSKLIQTLTSLAVPSGLRRRRGVVFMDPAVKKLEWN